MSQSSLPDEQCRQEYSKLFDGDIQGDLFNQKSPVIKPIGRRRNVRYSSDTPRKAVCIYCITSMNKFLNLNYDFLTNRICLLKILKTPMLL